MCNLWYLPLASRITKFKAPLEPKESCRGAEGLQSPWGDWQGNSSVSLQEFSHKSTACWHSVFEASDLRDVKQRGKWLRCVCTLKWQSNWGKALISAPRRRPCKTHLCQGEGGCLLAFSWVRGFNFLKHGDNNIHFVSLKLVNLWPFNINWYSYFNCQKESWTSW